MTTVILGSAENPDPILQEVWRLESQGIVKDVQVMESFPVRIWLTAPAEVHSKLERMPRKKKRFAE